MQRILGHLRQPHGLVDVLLLHRVHHAEAGLCTGHQTTREREEDFSSDGNGRGQRTFGLAGADGGVRLRCAGTVRPRQVQCPLGWLAIAQVSASQHQLVSSGEEEEKPQFFRYCVVTATAPATVSFAWVCTAAADTHRPTAHPAKLPGTRQEPQEHLEHLHRFPSSVSPLWARTALPPRLPEVLVLQ